MNVFNRFVSFCAHIKKITNEYGYPFATRFMLKTIRHKFFRISVIPLTAFVACLRPWIKIRFFSLSCLTVGHYSLSPEVLLCKIDQDKDKDKNHKEKTIFLQRPKSEVCNVQLYEMWKRIIPFSPDMFFPLCAEIESRLEHWFGVHRYKTILGQATYDRWDVLETSKQHLHFTRDELIKGEEILTTMGIPANAKFICLIVRDEAYYANKTAYNTYNDLSSYRNADILTYKKAALFLANNGYFVIRMGKKVNKAFDLHHEKVIDYANSHFRSDFMDIYLSAHCYFFMTTLCGLDGIAHAFRRPILATNITPNGYPFIGYPVKLFLLKKTIHKDTGQLLSIKQQSKIFRFEAVHEFIHKMLYDHSLKMIDNTEDEILEATKEMLLRMQENWHETALSEALHQKFWSEMTHHINEGSEETLPRCKYQARYCIADLLNNKTLLET